MAKLTDSYFEDSTEAAEGLQQLARLWVVWLQDDLDYLAALDNMGISADAFEEAKRHPVFKAEVSRVKQAMVDDPQYITRMKAADVFSRNFHIINSLLNDDEVPATAKVSLMGMLWKIQGGDIKPADTQAGGNVTIVIGQRPTKTISNGEIYDDGEGY